MGTDSTTHQFNSLLNISIYYDIYFPSCGRKTNVIVDLFIMACNCELVSGVLILSRTRTANLQTQQKILKGNSPGGLPRNLFASQFNLRSPREGEDARTRDKPLLGSGVPIQRRLEMRKYASGRRIRVRLRIPSERCQENQ